jgi:hypothetical protein
VLGRRPHLLIRCPGQVKPLEGSKLWDKVGRVEKGIAQAVKIDGGSRTVAVATPVIKVTQVQIYCVVFVNFLIRAQIDTGATASAQILLDHLCPDPVLSQRLFYLFVHISSSITNILLV